MDHLAKHFRNGALMKDWKGCRGLDPKVAAQVARAMPPYLIGQEAVSPIPFSATNATSLKCCMNYEPEYLSQHFEAFPDCPSPRNTQKMTCWEILTVRLGRFALEKMGEGVTPSDEMLQAHARRLLYDNDDPWNQTAADNPDWLKLFKKAHGLAPHDETDDPELNKSLLSGCWNLQECENGGDLEFGVPASIPGTFSLSPFAATEGPNLNMDFIRDISAPELQMNGTDMEDFDFDQIFTSMPEVEPLPDADMVFEDAILDGMGI